MRGTYRIKLALRRVRQRLLLARANRAVAKFPQVRRRAAHGLDASLVVTLTSYPPRFPDLAKTLRSLVDQTIAADRTELWVAESDAAALPREVQDLRAHGLTIETCRDIRSYKKLIPALERDAASYYVTADDDVYYPPHWLASLVRGAKAHPGAVIASRAHMAHLTDEGRLPPYASWELATSRTRSESGDAVLFPTGVGGILYPPTAFTEQVFDEKSFMEICPRGDDIWFFWMARMAGTPHRRTRDWFDIVEWPQTQEVALYNDNLLADGNDSQIRAMERRFGPVPVLATSEYAAQ